MTHGLKTKAQTLGVSKEDTEGFVVGALGRSESGAGAAPGVTPKKVL